MRSGSHKGDQYRRAIQNNPTATAITIRVDREVYEYLQKHIEGFGDTPNNVLRRLLKIGKQPKTEAGR